MWSILTWTARLLKFTVPGDPDIHMQLETHVKVDFFASCEAPRVLFKFAIDCPVGIAYVHRGPALIEGLR